MSEKEKKYELLLRQCQAMADGEHDGIALMANVTALIHCSFHFWWTGFYRVKGDELVLGPFQGPVACTHIAKGRGVCGTAWQAQRTVIVPDVEQFPGHIACSSESQSEIVVPVFQNDEVVAVLDIDSEKTNSFDETDRHWLEKIVALFKHTLPLFFALFFCWHQSFAQSSVVSGGLQSGDLLFVADTAGMGAAIAQSTGRYTHVAIVERTPDGLFVIESVPRHGTVRRSLGEFMAENAGMPVTAKRLSAPIDLVASVERAKGFLGQPYDNYFLPDNGKMYCSELVYESYLNPDGTHFFTANPMNFLAVDGTLPEYWEKHFRELNCKVPQDILGTNPSDLFKESELYELK